MAQTVEFPNVTVSSTGLYFSAESAERPAYFETTVQWAHPFRGRPDENCRDMSSRCEDWAQQGECERNAPYMHDQCALSCDRCTIRGKDVVWTLVSGELVLEGRKANESNWWKHLLEDPSPVNRIAYANDLEDSAGMLLECRDECPTEEEDAGCHKRCDSNVVQSASDRNNRRPPRVAAGRATG